MRKEVTTLRDVTNIFNGMLLAEIMFLIVLFSIFNIIVISIGCLVYYFIYYLFKTKDLKEILEVKRLEGICGVIHMVVAAVIFSFWGNRRLIMSLIIFVCILICAFIAVVIIDRYYAKVSIKKKPPISRSAFASLHCFSIILTFLLVKYTRISGNDISNELLFVGMTYASIALVADYLKSRRMLFVSDE